jgi:hypothetical protein
LIDKPKSIDCDDFPRHPKIFPFRGALLFSIPPLKGGGWNGKSALFHVEKRVEKPWKTEPTTFKP